MAASVTGGVEYVEGAIIEIVDGGEAADVEINTEIEFMDWTAFGI